MSRKPISTYTGGKGPRQRIWEAIRYLYMCSDAPFTEAAIWNMTEGAEDDIEMGAIRDYRRALVAAGILAEVTPAVSSPRKAATFQLIVDEGLEAPRLRKDGTRVTQGLAQEQMWRTLRMAAGDTNARELAAHASTESVPVAETAANQYLQMLNRAGYLVTTKASSYVSLQRYRLSPAKNTGPRPPMICRPKVVYDPNLGEVVWASHVTEEDAIYAA